MDIIRTIEEYSEEFFAHIFDNLDETDQFLERQKLSKLIQEGINNLNRSILIKKFNQ